MWELHCAAPGSAPPPPLRFFLFFDSQRASKALALSRHAHSHAHTRESSCQSKPCNPRARTTGERGWRQKRRKKREGASHRQQQQLPERRQQAVPGKPAAAAAAPTRTSGSICIPAPGKWGERCWASRRPRYARRARRRAGAPGPCSLRAADAAGAEAKARMSRGRASSESAESRGGGSRRGKGVASKTRIWSSLGLRRAGST